MDKKRELMMATGETGDKAGGKEEWDNKGDSSDKKRKLRRGIEPRTLTLLVSCSTTEPPERGKKCKTGKVDDRD